MTTQSPFVGDYAEYYARKSLRSAFKSESLNSLMRENEHLRQRVTELEDELDYYRQQIGILKSHAPKKSALRKLMDMLGL